ncbi:MAG: CDP-alcohol phosphatidyltransferase family protein [Chitinivibrionia bacterium]|nr:CDP-alcohol phosphatidyltransferase family protein [Chitinivibrionia bacterium]
MSGDIEKAYKLKREHRYFNISVLWIWYFPRVVRILHRLKIPHEAVTLLSLACGIGAGAFLLGMGYRSLLLAAVFVHLKDVFDASDGSLARLTGRTNRIARFLDSLFDLVVITWLLAAIAAREHPASGWQTAVRFAAAWVSIFMQCSYFNYYLVSYTRLFSGTNVRTDERTTEADKALYGTAWKRRLLLALQAVYGAVYGWQDRLIAKLDRKSLDRAGRGGARTPGEAGAEELRAWYGDKRLMTLNSPLCFGTHLFILILALIISQPMYFYYAIIFPGNAYLLFNIAYRERRFKREITRQVSNEVTR